MSVVPKSPSRRQQQFAVGTSTASTEALTITSSGATRFGATTAVGNGRLWTWSAVSNKVRVL